MALTESTMLALGTTAPEFALHDVVTGDLVRSSDFSGRKILLVLFLSAHCPYVKHIEKELTSFCNEFWERGVAILAIGANDAANYPEDGPEGMKQQALESGFLFPYLHDASQQVARAFQAACTPDIFLFDGERKLVYRGQFDSSRPGNSLSVNGEDLRLAIEAVLAGKFVSSDQRPSIGCNIKWKA